MEDIFLRDQVTGNESGASTAIVLANKNREVEDAFSEMFPRTRQRSASTSSRSGGISGGAAADRANLSRSVGGGQRVPDDPEAVVGCRPVFMDEGQMYALPDVQILAIRAVVNNAAPAVRGLQKLLAEMKGAD